MALPVEQCKGEKLEATSTLPFPSMLLLKKRPLDVDPAARAKEMLHMKKRSTAVLDRFSKFLPLMKESDHELRHNLQTMADPSLMDIEKLEEGAPAVEFNLALFEYSSSDSEDSAGSDSTNSSPSAPTDEDVSNKSMVSRITELPG